MRFALLNGNIFQKLQIVKKMCERLTLYLLENCNIKLSISSVRVSLVTARCGLGEEGAVGDRRGQAGRAGQAA